MPATENPNPQPAPSLEPLPIALIYVPPIVDDQPDSELEMIGRKIAIALDRHDRDARSVFRVATEFVEVRGRKEKVCRILRTDPATGGERAVADVFRLDYREKLLARTACSSIVPGVVRAGVGGWVYGRNGLISEELDCGWERLESNTQTICKTRCALPDSTPRRSETIPQK